MIRRNTQPRLRVSSDVHGDFAALREALEQLRIAGVRTLAYDLRGEVTGREKPRRAFELGEVVTPVASGPHSIDQRPTSTP